MLPKCETLYEDMIDILEEYKKYVPFKTVTLSEPLVEGTTVITETNLMSKPCLVVITYQQLVPVSSTDQENCRVRGATLGWIFTRL